MPRRQHILRGVLPVHNSFQVSVGTVLNSPRRPTHTLPSLSQYPHAIRHYVICTIRSWRVSRNKTLSTRSCTNQHLKYYDGSNKCHGKIYASGLRRRSAGAWLLGLRFRIPLRACCLLCVVQVVTSATGSFRESYRVCVCVCVCLVVCDLETSTMRRPRPELGCCATEKPMKC
jgi:hypothetical protein